MAAAIGAKDLLWLVNDSGGTPTLHLAGTDGSDRGGVTVDSAHNVDWEDLASFSWQGKPFLLIADTGDNAARRKSCKLYLVPEPTLPAAGKMLQGAVKPQRVIEFRYPDGPRDCESVAVDAMQGKILLLSKRTTPPGLYELPLSPPKTAGVAVAKKIGSTELRAGPGVLPHPFATQPTGLDIRADCTQAAVLTYVGVFVFPRARGETWAQAFARQPTLPPPHGLPQAEALAFSRDGKSLFVASEGARSPLARYRLQPAP
jgi:hypothetical protein